MFLIGHKSFRNWSKKGFPMKKRISVITLIPRSGQYYARQVQELFGSQVEVRAYSTGD